MAGLGILIKFFVQISYFLKSEGAICSFKRANCFFHSFCKERFTLLQRARKAMKSESLFYFGHKKREKHGEKNKFEANHSYKEQITLS